MISYSSLSKEPATVLYKRKRKTTRGGMVFMVTVIIVVLGILPFTYLLLFVLPNTSLILSRTRGCDEMMQKELTKIHSINTKASSSSSSSSMKNNLAIDCPAMLHEFLNGKISEMELRKGFEKSYVTRTNTAIPFYWATHKGELDMPRQITFEKGEYYEKELTARIQEAFDQVKNQGNRSSIFLDVGGNIGWYSLVAAAHGASKVYTFEPNPSNIVRICESLQLNGWNDIVDLMMVGVSDKDGKQSLYKVDPNNPGMFSFDENRAKKYNQGNPEVVSGEFQLVTLDQFAQDMGWFQSRPSIRFFKLDVEGFEPKIIKGAEKLFRSRIIDQFAMEMKRKLHSDKDKEMIVKILFDSGYELFMEGAWKGPKNYVHKKYDKWEDLAQDIIQRKYGENILFRRIDDSELRIQP